MSMKNTLSIATERANLHLFLLMKHTGKLTR